MNLDASRLVIPDGLLRKQPIFSQPQSRRLSSNLFICEIQDVIAYAHCYIVQGAGLPRMAAVLGSSLGSFLPAGVRDASMLAPGTLVLCWVGDFYTAVILCALPAPMGSAFSGVSDSVVARGHAGFFGDVAHQFIGSREDGHGLFDFSCGRPLDTVAGDWGIFNELGLGAFIGKFLALLRASDACKLEMFYLDNLARLIAFNWQIYTSGSELEAFNDEGEWTKIEGFNPYPWEAQGLFNKGALFEESAAVDLDPLKGEKFGFEPRSQYQTGIWRLRIFDGYLGELSRKYVLLPDATKEVMVFGTRDGETAKTLGAYKGVFEEHIGLNGSYRLRSAKDILFEKTIWLPVPEELMPRDHPDGDSDFTNAAGLNTTLAEFVQENSSAEIALTLDDKRIYEEGKYASQGFNNRRKDWSMEDPPKVPGGFENEEPPLLPYSGFSQALPPVGQERVDHRKTERFFQGKARFGVTEDGGFIIEDAYGSSIKLVGGNIELSCPGDILMRPGRSGQIWAGKDVILKGNKNVDISAAQEDVRVKAEKNLFILGGNAKTSGGVLIENRSEAESSFTGTASDTSVGGLTLKASRGQLNLLGEEIHARTSNGPITLDSNDGDFKADIYFFGRTLERFLSQGSVEVVGSKDAIEESPENDLSIMRHQRNQFILSGGTVNFGISQLNIVNRLAGVDNASVRIKGNLFMEGRGSATLGFSKIKQTGGSAFIQDKQLHFENAQDTLTLHVLPIIAAYASDDALIFTYYSSGVFFRDSDELDLGNMELCEAPWQKRFRRGFQQEQDAEKFAGNSFKEETIYSFVDAAGEDQGVETMPFPGYSAWTSGDTASFVRYDEAFREYSAQGSRPIPRGENPDESFDLSKLKTPNKSSFEDRYPVNS